MSALRSSDNDNNNDNDDDNDNHNETTSSPAIAVDHPANYLFVSNLSKATLVQWLQDALLICPCRDLLRDEPARLVSDLGLHSWAVSAKSELDPIMKLFWFWSGK